MIHARFAASMLISGTLGWAAMPSAQINIPAPVPKAATVSVQLPAKPKNYKEGQVLVKYKENIKLSQATASIAAMNTMHVAKTFGTLSRMKKRAYVLVESQTLSTEELMEILQKDPNVAHVEPNYLYHPKTTPNDPKMGELWGLNNTGQEILGSKGQDNADINGPESWDITQGSDDVVIAVIDTGVDYKHEDLADNMWVNSREIPDNGIDDDNNSYVDDIYGINAIDGSGDPMDVVAEDGGHGTHVAGTIAAVGNNNKGITGVSWNAKIMALKFLGEGGGTTADAITCLEYMIDQKNLGVNVIASNNSWGGGEESSDLKDAIQASNDAGILFIAAAGNDANDNDASASYPSSYDLDGIIAVAATDSNDTLASFSNYGATTVDLAAPGVSILSSTPRAHIPTSSDIFFDDMENGMDNWTTGGTNNSWAISEDQEIFENSSFPVPSPTHFLSDNPGNYYASDTDSWVMLKNDLDLSAYADQPLYLGLGVAAYIEDYYDHATIELSADGGSTWETLFDYTGYARYWQSPYTYEIPDKFKTANFRLRFHLTSDGSVEYDGWLIDNVGIGTSLSSTYGYKSGTSMATPHVSGAVAVIGSVFTNDTIAERKQRLMDSVDQLSSLDGKMVTGGRLNLLSALQTGIPEDENCTDGEHFIQGSGICVPGDAVTFNGPFIQSCPDGERKEQGIDDTDSCVSTAESRLEDNYLTTPTCDEDQRPVQGTDYCE